MERFMKAILRVIAVVSIMAVGLWGSITYVSEYKVTTVDTSVSPDGTHELVLQAVGEADFSFGSATGRLILYEGKSKISKADFELFDDGGCIRSGIWEVAWQEDCVGVILSGEEQLDEQILLYFDGRKESKQLTDWERYGDEWPWDAGESGETDSRTVYAGESEDMGKDGEDANLAHDIDSIEKINEYRIPEQSFDVTLDDWGEVTFISCRPLSWEPYEEPSFFLVGGEQIVYEFPNHSESFGGLFDSIGAVAFRDINEDGKDDIIVIMNYITGAGPQGMLPRPALRIFLAGEKEFYFAEDMMADIEQHMPEQDMTIENICNYLKDKN